MPVYENKEDYWETFDDYDPEDNTWDTFRVLIKAGWYFYGEDGPSCPTGPFATKEEADSAFSYDMDRMWEDLVGPLESLGY